MFKEKKIALGLVILLIVSIVSLSGCGKEDAGDASAVDQDEKVIEISYGHGFMPETPHHKAAIKFKEDVEAKSNNRIKVNLFPSGQLGSAREMFEGLQMGTQEIALVPTARISGFAPELQLFDLPFLFPTREIAYQIMDGKVGDELLHNLESQQVKGIAFYEDGFKHFTANNELRSIEDFRGVKFRTMESPIIMNQFRALGSNPVPIDFSELYNSLQLGVVDGQENPLVTILNMKFYEVQDYLMISSHAYLGHVLIFSNSWFNSLPEDIQEILVSTGRDVAQWQRAAVQEEEVAYLKTIEESGTTIIHLTEQERNVMRDATRSVHDEYRKLFGDDILDKTYEEIDRLNN
ncbi:TRAP transporter substrate-binding protein [Alkaliphilus peptidifermentans]|uniref:C4-dicarboxylate-binding protein DctP n=1 Tax=Alkaliphilus peptidifermentans DSM 18978 TaxID=1120976 RepID=A0A1G5AF02_9FIRM|nr:TRAP transporter substrate-binding protein [Alkaliphilus peptidifermentans]SCX76473.1 C4-dicarboxylate-binding protein DctP [Alkaliphilus peptidifermentans DSM 18978]